jgi:hypothetical protein
MQKTVSRKKIKILALFIIALFFYSVIQISFNSVQAQTISGTWESSPFTAYKISRDLFDSGFSEAYVDLTVKMRIALTSLPSGATALGIWTMYLTATQDPAYHGDKQFSSSDYPTLNKWSGGVTSPVFFNGSFLQFFNELATWGITLQGTTLTGDPGGGNGYYDVEGIVQFTKISNDFIDPTGTTPTPTPTPSKTSSETVFSADMFPLTLTGIRTTTSGVEYVDRATIGDLVFVDGTAIKPTLPAGYTMSSYITLTYTPPTGSIIYRTAEALYATASISGAPDTFDTLWPSEALNKIGTWVVRASASITISSLTGRTQSITAYSNSIQFIMVAGEPKFLPSISFPNGTSVPTPLYTNANNITTPQLTETGSGRRITFQATGASGTKGVFTMNIPNTLVPEDEIPTVDVNGVPASEQHFTVFEDSIAVSFATHFSTVDITIEFTKTKTSYDVTISATFSGVYNGGHVEILEDGIATGYSTPHTFTELRGTHNFTVPYTDNSGHPFICWGTSYSGDRIYSTISVSSGGEFTAFYVSQLDFTDMYPAECIYLITPSDPAVVVAASGKSYSEIIDFVETIPYTSNTTRQFPNQTLTTGSNLYINRATLCCSMLRSQGYKAYTVRGTVTDSNIDTWVVLDLNNALYIIDSSNTAQQQSLASSNYQATYYIDEKGIYSASYFQPTLLPITNLPTPQVPEFPANLTAIMLVLFIMPVIVIAAKASKQKVR